MFTSILLGYPNTYFQMAGTRDNEKLLDYTVLCNAVSNS